MTNRHFSIFFFKSIFQSVFVLGQHIDSPLFPLAVECWREMKELVHNFLLSQNLDTSPEARTV